MDYDLSKTQLNKAGERQSRLSPVYVLIVLIVLHTYDGVFINVYFTSVVYNHFINL